MTKTPVVTEPIKLSPGDIKNYLNNFQALASILSNFKDMLYIIDVKTLKPKYSNRSLLNILGYSQAQIHALGPQWAQHITHPDDLHLIAKHIDNFTHMKGNNTLRILFRMKNSSGEYRLFESLDSPFSFDEKMHITEVIGITRDITDAPKFFDPYAHHHEYTNQQHRCRTCNKLLGTENSHAAVIDIKCNRCGDINSFFIQGKFK
jgi:PAS domain S-box-containing protein